MTQPAMTVEGDERLRATMHAAADDIGDMSSTGRAVGELVRVRAATTAPKLTGALASSVRASETSGEVEIASDLVYAARVNFGAPSVGQAAQPFMTDALADTENLITEAYERDVARAVSQVKGA